MARRPAPPRSGRPGARHGHTPEGALFTELLLEVFRANGTLVAAGNTLAARAGISLARWLVLGAIVLVGRPLTVAQLGRTIGLTRQSVQRVVEELEDEGLVKRGPHPTNQRALPVTLTVAGMTAFNAVSRYQEPWANRIGKAVSRDRLAAAVRTLRELRSKLEADVRSG